MENPYAPTHPEVRDAVGRLCLKFAGAYHGHADMFLVSAGSGAATFGIPNSPGVTAGAVADIVQQGNLGIVADPDDVEAIAQALSQLYEHRHRLAEAFPYDEGYIQQFDGNVLSARLQAILAKVSRG